MLDDLSASVRPCSASAIAPTGVLPSHANICLPRCLRRSPVAAFPAAFSSASIAAFVVASPSASVVLRSLPIIPALAHYVPVS